MAASRADRVIDALVATNEQADVPKSHNDQMNVLFSLVVIGLWKKERQCCYLDGPWAVYLWPSSRLTLSVRRRHLEASMMQTNEWALLKRQFDALVHDESGAESAASPN
jgi:hypothetical protein